MFSWFTNHFGPKQRAIDLYGAVVVLARTPLFYNQMGVADTPEGRYEILVLHLFLIMERLRSIGGEANRLSQEVIDKFVIDIDDNIREMGVGDLTVPKKVKKAAAAFYDRAKVYRNAIEDQNSGKLISVLTEFIPSAKGHKLDAKALALYVTSLNNSLRDQPLNNLVQTLMPSTPVV